MTPRTPSRLLRTLLIAVAGVVTTPALLNAFDRSAALVEAGPLIGGAPRSLDGLRRRATSALAAKRYEEAARDARAFLARQPLDRSALRTLAMAEAAQGNDELSGEVVVDASFVSRRDPYTELQMFDLSAVLGRLDDAARRADAVSRIADFQREGFQALDSLLSLPGGVRAVSARLATRPPWRAGYLGRLADSDVASDTIAALVSGVDRTTAPVTSAELNRLLGSMIAAGEGSEAWRIWRSRNGGRGRALVDDPDMRFAQQSEAGDPGSPFVWSMPADTLVRLVAHRDANGRPALRVEGSGDRSAMFVSRTVVASPGRYRLSYAVSVTDGDVERLRPEVRCVTRAAVRIEPMLAERPGSPDTLWSATVVVPEGCGSIRLGFTLEMSDEGTPVDLAIRGVALSTLN